MKHSRKWKEKLKKRLVGGTLSILVIIMLIVGSNLALLNMHINPLAGIKNLINTAFSSDEINMINGNETESIIQKTSVEILDGNIVVCDSIVQGVRDAELIDGTYTFRVTGKNSDGTEETKEYEVELININDENVHYSLEDGEESKTISLGNNTTDYKMLVVKYHGNLTIDEGVKVTASTAEDGLTYKKGMYLCVMGNLINNGEISMTARGTYNQEGENVYLWKNINDTYEYVPAIGGAAGTAVSSYSGGNYWTVTHGKQGGNGQNRQTGGGGSGASSNWNSSGTSGSGSAGTSYSGGSGGGAQSGGNMNQTAWSAQPNGGAGGQGYARRRNSGHSAKGVGGGAGNLGGKGWYSAGGDTTGYATDSYKGDNGTGGLLILYAKKLFNEGQITAKGSNGGKQRMGDHDASGGSSGGGSINIFANDIVDNSQITAKGGVSSGNSSFPIGGAGGEGSVTINKLYPDLNYSEKVIELNVGQDYAIDKNQIQLINQNKIQINPITLGRITFDALDSTIADVDANGKITANKTGKTKIKITDIDNDISTYVYVQVINNTKIDVQEGKNFTVALKQNGTVWSYGLNDNGQLGIGNNDNQTEPVQVQGVSDIKQIATGYSHALALTKSGEIYAWGLGTNGQLGDGEESNSNIPVKVDIKGKIVKIDAYKNISTALDSDGNMYIWGENYANLPMKVVFSEKIVDMSGTLVLTTNGEVYDILDTSNPTKIEGLSRIAKISAGYVHYLALDVEGRTYAWGTNTYGECGTVATGNIIVPTKIATDMYNISAGNQISILQDEEGKVYVLGNNANGQIGLSTTAKATELTEITLSEEVEESDEPNSIAIEEISAGEGTHTGLIDENGFIWDAGLNTNGELGNGDNIAKNVYSQIGETIIVTNFEKKYLDINESETIIPRLENTFNLKIDVIDENQNNFSIELSDDKTVELDGKQVTALEYGTVTATIKYKDSEITKDVKIVVAMKMESIVQGFRDAKLVDGEYSIVVNEQEYIVELINVYDENKVYSENTELGDNSTEHKTLVVKYHGDLTINEGVTLTASTAEDGLTYKKGMYLCVLGNIYNNGTISMTARGTYNQEGEDVYLWKNIDDTYEYVPAIGGAGGAGKTTKSTGYYWTIANGNPGETGENRQTGGGGSGASANYCSTGSSGSGSAGTSYSGGSGGGAQAGGQMSQVAQDAQPNGGAGGNAYARRYRYNHSPKSVGGGAGNPGGKGWYSSGNNITGNATTDTSKGEDGTGGLLILYANNLFNNGEISAKGSNGGKAILGDRNASGGSSGGGSINIFAKHISTYSITAKGGASNGNSLNPFGGAGGDGTITINELGSVLNYAKKTINLQEKENYNIDKTKLSYTKLNEKQTEDLVLGKVITFDTLNQDIATVDSQGNITAVSAGKTKIKITDTENGYSTYIIVNVTKQGLTVPQIKAGTDFTIALKANGTVWSFGNNANGQLGNNTQERSNEPVQVLINDSEVLENIIDIGAGESSAIAVNSSGEVYTWGLNIKDVEEEIEQETEEGTEITTQIVRYQDNILTATKVDGLHNIEKVECYNKNFYAIDEDGNLYVWGEGYSGSTKIDTKVKVEDISGDILLGQDGRVYLIKDTTTPIRYLNSICEISAGSINDLFLTLEGKVYSVKTGDIEELKKETHSLLKVPYMVSTINGYLENVSSISAGNGTSMAVTYDGEAYVWGDNTNKKLGITEANTNYATQILHTYDKEGIELELKPFEIVEAGNNSSYLADKDGYVYSVGLNSLGQLGTEDNTNRTVFTKIGKTDIITMPEEIKVPLNKAKEISIALSNSFNLKTDIAEGDPDIINTNKIAVELEKIAGVDNSETTNIDDFIPNYKITGNKIDRIDFVVSSKDVTRNIWIDVINNETAEVSAKVVNGNGFTISLKSDGTVWSWGTNTSGQLGLGDSSSRNSPEKIEVPETIKDISSGASHTLLLGKSGEVYTFGANGNGQLGTGNSTTYKIPTNIRVTNIEKVKAIGNSSYAITSEGKVFAWGAGYGKTPVLLSMNKNVIDIGRTYYLADDGIVRTIPTSLEEAEGTQIELSLNEYEIGTRPVIEEERIVQISEGIDHVLLLGESGKVYSYGTNVYGQLGDNSDNARQNNITTVVRKADKSILQGVVEVSAGDQYSIVVTEEGKVYTFGINGDRQLGQSNELETGGMQESDCAILKVDIEKVERVSAGYTHTNVYTEDGDVYTWGNGENGQLGNSDNSSYWEAQLVGKNIVESNTNEILIEEGEIFNLKAWVNYFNLFEERQSEIGYEVLDQSIAFVDATSGQVMGLSEGRTTVIAKERNTGEIGVISVRVLEEGTKPDTMEILVEPQVVTSGKHTVMLKVDGTVWCYGIGTNGELGNGTNKNTDQPVQAEFPAGTIITKISAGENHCLALDNKGNVWAWGANDYNQLGKIGDIVTRPTKITELQNIKDIECGTYSSFAIGKSGEVYSWGLNANGEGGIGSYTSKIEINRALHITDAIDIKAGKNHTMILRSTGEVYVTGSNLYGELGIARGVVRSESTLGSTLSQAEQVNFAEQNLLGAGGSINKVKQFTKVEGLDKVVAISAGDSNNTVLTTKGEIYSWGSNIYKELGVGSTNAHLDIPTKVIGLNNIKYIDGGKGYTLAIDSENNVYEIGLNSSGELGDNSNINANTYKKLTTISEVIQLSAGNGYTMFLKEDGTVWACGDYTHGDRDIKSKTKSIIPVQVGNDETGLEKTEITIEVNGSAEIADNCAYEFNLIKLEENLADSLDFNSLKEEIATVNESGLVTGRRVGTTRVNAISNVDGKVYSVLVKVVEKKGQYAPKVEGGENFGAVLKANGEIWTFGYNADGRLALGNNITKDTPEKTNVISTYKDIKVGKDFIIALRDNGTVWSSGNNKYGQLGNGTTLSSNKLTQIQGLNNIVQIAVGDNFAIAMDDLGIVYAWGNNNNGQLGNIGINVLIPTEITVGSQRILDLAGGNKQIAFVTAKGTVLGMGHILSGTVPNIGNAIKAEITKDSIIILTSDCKVYEYKNSQVTEINIRNVIDISAKNGNVMYQTIDEEIYVSGENIYGELGVDSKVNVEDPVKTSAHGNNAFGIGVGYTNTYIIENTGNVYGAGNNQYGSLGNGTREERIIHTLIGQREFTVEPESAIMHIGDKEDISVIGMPFNVFDNRNISNEEYEWNSDKENIVSVDNGHLTALEKGTAHITVKDKVTEETVTITRIVIEQDKDRIAEIKVDDTIANLSSDSTEDDIKYEVKVVTNNDTGLLEIQTKERTDRIKVNKVGEQDSNEWSNGGTYRNTVDLTEKITEFIITVQPQNNTGNYEGVESYTYKLKVEKISNDAQLERITVTSTNDENEEETIQAIPVSSNKYEVVIGENTELSQVTAIARNEYSYVSIDGLDYEIHQQTTGLLMENISRREVTIVVKTEAGTEVEYTLIIHRQSEIMNLLDLKVNGEDPNKVSETVYAITVGKDDRRATVKATAQNSLAYISIANKGYESTESTREVSLNGNVTEISIKVMVGDDIKEYTLYIYKQQENEEIPEDIQLDMLLVNGVIVEPEEDKLTYIVYLPSTETEATIKAIANQSSTSVVIDDNQSQQGENEKEVNIPALENIFTVKLTNESGEEKLYTVKILKADKDTSIQRIYVSKEDTQIEATLQDDGTYLVKVPSSYLEVDVTAIARHFKAKVKITEQGEYVVKQNTSHEQLTDEITQVKIKVQSEDGVEEKEYILNIVKKSSNTDLLKVEVDGTEIQIGEDGKYHYELTDGTTLVNVKAQTNNENANVKIANGDYEIHETERQVDITAKQTEIIIKVKAEDGQTKDYILVIEGLPDDATIKEVTVNGEKANYIEGKNRYEIRLNNATYEIQVTLNDLLATMILGSNEQETGIGTITVDKSGAETIIKVAVTSQNKLVTEEYVIAILEKSGNANIDTLKVNDKIINPELDGNYYATIKNSDTQINIEAIAEDTYSVTSIDNNSNNTYIATFTQDVVGGTTIYRYTITVVSENGTSKQYSLTVEQLEANTDIVKVQVGKTEVELSDASLQGEVYYCKIDRVEDAYVKVELASEKSKATINGDLADPAKVSLPNEKNTFTIKVTGEDGTEKDYTLIIEKKSADTNVLSIEGQGVITTEIGSETAEVYVDEDLATIELTITLNSEFASLKLAQEVDYVLNSLTTQVDLSDYDTAGVVTLTLSIQAEDGTEKEYLVNVYKQADLGLLSVVVNQETIEYNEETERYETIVSNGERPQVEITESNVNQKLELLNSNGDILVTGAQGTINTTVTLSNTELVTKFIIRVTSHNGEDYGVSEYELWIIQKSTETGIKYVKVDESGTMVNEDTYSGTVSGKESYPVEIKLKDEKAQVKVQDLEGNELIGNQIGTLRGELDVPDGQTREFKIIVTSENGDIKEYSLFINRISSNLEIASITVTDYEEDGSTNRTRQVINYDRTTKTYKIVVNKELRETEINISTVSEFTNVVLDATYRGNQTASMRKALTGKGTVRITIQLTAADGAEETRYLEIVQLSDEIGIQKVEVDGLEVEANDAGNYETTVTDEVDISKVKVVLIGEESKVSINGQTQQVKESTVEVRKGNNRTLEIPIEVTAEDETTYTYILILNIISHDTSVREVKVDDEIIGYVDNKYKAYIGVNQQEANIEILAGVPYSTIKHKMEDNTELLQLEELRFTADTSNLQENIFIITFTIIAEDEEQKEYTIELIRKSDDNTIKEVYVDETKLEKNKDNPLYDDDTYYIAVTGNIAKVKVIANNEFATVEFNSNKGLNWLEQRITLKDKITEIPVTITSQEGTEYRTTIYIEKLSTNNELLSVEVNYEQAQKVENKENTYISYIYEFMVEANIQITAKDEYATIMRTNIDGTKYTDENNSSFEDKGQLQMQIQTTENSTVIYFKIISENKEESEVYTLYIDKMSTDATLSEIYVDGEPILPNEEGEYIANVLDTNTNPLVRAITTHDKAVVRIALGNEYLHIAEQRVEMSTSKKTIIPITVISQAGTKQVTNLYINKISTSVALNTVRVNDREADYYTEETDTYRFLVDAEQTEFELYVLAESDYTTLEFNGKEYETLLRDVVNMDTDTEGITLKVKATSESGIEKEYTIEIARKSDNVELEYIKVDGILRYPDEGSEDTYTVGINKLAEKAQIEIKTKYSYAMVKISDNKAVRQMDTKEVKCNLSEEEIRVPIVVTASDGITIKTYYVKLVRIHTLIQGNIITENLDNIYTAKVRLYRRKRKGEEYTDDELELETEVDTTNDGRYVIEIEEAGTYQLVVEKPGYLSYTVADIEITPGLIVEIEEHKLIAGDVEEDGEIEIADLVELNANLGIEITEDNKEEKGKYDLNEDGTIDMTDRNILKSNYGKKDEVEIWVKPDEVDAINLEMDETVISNIGLPLACEYRISSDYGERVNPVTGEDKLHAGIDIVGEHHTEILSIAEGEVTYAGVQNGYGNCIEIKHVINGETIYSFYAHLSRIDVKVGDKVEKGQVIGLEGGAEEDPNHGNSTGHHLHFELRSATGSGHSIDPREYIRF